jgi:hypothetical protein
MPGVDDLILAQQYVTHDLCNIRHKEVERLSIEVDDMRKAFELKLDKIMTVLLTIQITIIAALASGLIYVIFEHVKT